MAIAEVILIGTGGYGESILINLGDDTWIIVDSCVDPENKTPQNIEYLKNNNIELEKVKLFVCTHWHDDHILGISQALKECENAQLSFARPNDIDKFLRLIKFDIQKGRIEKHNSATYEFNECLEINAKREKKLKRAIQDRLLMSRTIGEGVSEVYSLSPSDFTLEKFDTEIVSKLAIKFGQTSKKIPNDSPNAKSVVLYVKLGSHRVILGADLEVSKDNREGWLNIIENSECIDKKSSLFKIPHHGSINGYHDNIWNILLEQNPVAKLTPWNKGWGLPNTEMLRLYSKKTDKLFMTKQTKSKSPKKRDKQIEKIIEKSGRNLQEIKYRKGIIKCSINIEDENDSWKVELIENAIHIDPQKI